MALLLCPTISASAKKRSLTMSEQAGDTKRMKDAVRHSEDAAKVFDEIMAVPDKSIPKDLLDKAEAIAVFPGVVKAAFIIGGSGGQGSISRRTARGWSAPAFFKIGGGSFGAQIGAEKTDYVLLIMNEKGLRGLLEDKFEIGGEASIGWPGRAHGVGFDERDCGCSDTVVLTQQRSVRRGLAQRWRHQSR